jgi:hypothetical protein
MKMRTAAAKMLKFVWKETEMSDETIHIFESKFEILMVFICHWTV